MPQTTILPVFDTRAAGTRAPLRLICLPHAGGGSHMFADWPVWLSGVADVCPAHLPGRGARHAEAPYTNVAAAVAAIVEGLLPLCDRPVALFGHSMGALLAFETARAIGARGHPVQTLIVAGSPAPHVPPRREAIWNLPLDAFVERLRDYDGTPPELLSDAEMMALVLPYLRADFQMVDTYAPSPGPPLECPIFAFAGKDDESVVIEDVRQWGGQTRGRFAMQVVPGGHFFIRSSEVQVLRALERILTHLT